MTGDPKPEYRLDLADERLWLGDQPVTISNKAFRILRLFVTNPNRLLTKDEILDAVWGDLCVSEGLVKDYVHDLRVALGDDPASPGFIETIRGRGYRFLGGIRVVVQPSESSLEASAPTEVPSLAVLPFINMSDEADQEYFSDGITEDIITELSRFPELSVVARNSAFSFKDRPAGRASPGRAMT